MTCDCSPSTQARIGNATPRILACCVLAATMTAYGGSANAQTDPQKLAAALRGEDKGAADKNLQCKLFTPAELAKFVGMPLGPGRVAAMGSGCHGRPVPKAGAC